MMFFWKNQDQHESWTDVGHSKVVVHGQIFLRRYCARQMAIVCQSYDPRKLMYQSTMALTKTYPSLKENKLVRHAKLFLPYHMVGEMNPSLKAKSLVRHVKIFQFLTFYQVEQSKSKDFQLDDVYVALVDDPISSSGESIMSLMSDHVDQ